jgi:hypothetical protein
MVDGLASPHWHRILIQTLGTPKDEAQRTEWSRAARWRLGKFYLSAMREIDLLARVRAAGVPLRYHLLADVLLRTDFWIGDLAICLYFGNPRYRDGIKGRKAKAAELFRGANPKLHIEEFHIPRQGAGNFWLVTEEDIQRLIRLTVPVGNS